MDKIDQKILVELDKNPRASFNQIGKSSRISKEVAQYRFKQLLNKGIIDGFFAYINTSKLGYEIYKILIKYMSVSKEIQEEIKSFIEDNKDIAWAGYCEGRWDLIITVLPQTKKEFYRLYSNFFNNFGKYFKEKEILIPTKNPIFNDKYLIEGKLIYEKNLDFNCQKEKLDEKDKKIIKELSLNSRMTFTEIGKKVDLSYWAVAKRFKKLLKEEIIILLKPRINFQKLGYKYYHLLIELYNEKIKESIASYYRHHKDCTMIMEHIGFYSIHLEFVLKQEDLQNILLEFREKFGKEIAGYEPLLILEEYVMRLLR